MSATVVLEGCDSVGKNTQSKLLAAKLDSVGRSAAVLSFPRYETEAGKAIRRHLMGELFVGEMVPPMGGHALAPEDPLFLQALFLADKADATADILEHLANERIVICDRWVPLADLNILIDVPEEEALRRRPQLRDRYEKDREKQKVVRANYDTLWKAGTEEDEPGAWVRVDGVGTVEEVAARIWKPVAVLLGIE